MFQVNYSKVFSFGLLLVVPDYPQADRLSGLSESSYVWIIPRVATFQSLSNSPNFPWLFQVFPKEELTFIKPSAGLINVRENLGNLMRTGEWPTCTPEWILWHYWQSILCMSTLLNSYSLLRLGLLSDYHNCSSTSQANSKQQFPWLFLISLTNVKFPDFSRFSRPPCIPPVLFDL